MLLVVLIITSATLPTFIQSHTHKESQTKTTHTFDGTVFMHTVRSSNGISQQTWTINNKEVPYETYQKQLSQARVDVCNKEQEKEQEQINNTIALEKKLHEQIEKKLLSCAVQKVEFYIHALEKNNLMPYVTFSQKPFEGMTDFVSFKNYTLFPAQTLLVSSNFDLEKAQTLLPLLEKAEEPLRILYYTTLEHAIKTCDDSQQLKQWLEILS